jgi:hypothetical protein
VTALTDVRWIHGTPHRGQLEDPLIQVHRHDEDTVLLRQSNSTSFEAPFLSTAWTGWPSSPRPAT